MILKRVCLKRGTRFSKNFNYYDKRALKKMVNDLK